MSLRGLRLLLLGCVLLIGFSLVGVFGGVLVEIALVITLGALLASLYLLQRITERVQAHQDRLQTLQMEQEALTLELNRRHRRHITLLEGLPIPLMIGERDATLRFVNHTALEWFGYRPMTGKSLLALTFSYDLYVLYLRAVRRRAHTVSEVTLSFPQERHVVATVWFIGELDHTELFAIALLDKSELVRLEQVRRDFVANVSHEFRTPLASIRALAETILHDDQMPAETRNRFLNLIIQETERLTRIAEDLLILSRAEALPPTKEPLDLNTVVRNTLSQVQAEAEKAKITIESHLQEPLIVPANRDQMVQVVLNLLTNAIRYNKPEGKIWVRTFTRDHEAVLEVQDTGIGIPSEDLPRIFERFYRVDKTRSRETGGTGLGLAIVKHIVESHGGRVEVESEYRVGSTFRVVLPLGAPLSAE